MIYYFILDSKIIMVVRIYPQIQSYKLIYNSKRKRLGILAFLLSACRDRADHKRAWYKFVVNQLFSIQKQN